MFVEAELMQGLFVSRARPKSLSGGDCKPAHLVQRSAAGGERGLVQLLFSFAVPESESLQRYTLAEAAVLFPLVDFEVSLFPKGSSHEHQRPEQGKATATPFQHATVDL